MVTIPHTSPKQERFFVEHTEDQAYLNLPVFYPRNEANTKKNLTIEFTFKHWHSDQYLEVEYEDQRWLYDRTAVHCKGLFNYVFRHVQNLVKTKGVTLNEAMQDLTVIAKMRKTRPWLTEWEVIFEQAA